MRHKIVVLVCLIAVFSLGVLSVHAWQNQQVQARVAASKAAAAQAYHDKAQELIVKRNYEKANADCKKGQQAYDGQTAAYRKANPARPLCDLPIAQ